ncbi:MAG: aldehyde dehydrogenase family protein [candidate division Zixibacteria bacterium]|nr:aldehyde dehydrogenase family protein [candidate division Zixibacteria bacterium]
MANTDEIIQRAQKAAAAFRELDQPKTDRIARAVYLTAMDNRVRLAIMAAEETGMGFGPHKVIKNVIASQLVYEHIKDHKTVGVISEDSFAGIIEMAQPLGPILALIPAINPTSTTIFKILITMKTRNPVIISGNAIAKNCVAETARVCYEAALKAGAPEHCIQWLTKPNPMKTKELMSHRALALILATGTGELVKASYSSGTPTIGVGSGNVPVYVGATADIPFALQNILMSKTFDNGSICASEQAIVVKKEIAEKVTAEFKIRKAYFLSPEEIEKVGRIAYDKERGTMLAGVVGQSVQRIAEMAGIEVPVDASVLIAKLDKVSPKQPLSAEILAPILAFYVEESFEAAIARCMEITRFGGIGHTAVIYSNNPERIEYFSRNLDVARILVNTPSTQGALGGMFNTLPPSFTLSCGSGGKNSTTDNISTRHLLNIHRICRRRINERWKNIDHRKYLDESLTAGEIEREFNKNT